MSETAKGGFRNEEWIASQFNDHKRSHWAEGWLKTMGYGLDSIDHICSQTTRKMGFFNKADVLVLAENNVEWISVKKFTASFSQIDKKWTDAYAKLWNMPEDVKGIFKKYCGEKEHRPSDMLGETQLRQISDRRRFRMDELSGAQRERVLDFLDDNRRKIVRDVIAGSGKASAKWMLLVEERNGSPYRSTVLPIDAVIGYCTGVAAITTQGNLKLGKLTIQRKGGDAGKPTAQMLQFKFSPRGLFDIPGINIIESRTRE